jgi:(1->4)-alpha-D-glucan 1-alpha-D-glucosylmutase
VRIPRATYRLQFSHDFTFSDAADLAPYLAEIGVGDLYASPYLKARPGSMHGYDVVDPTSLNPELGGEQDYRRLVQTLRDHGMDQLLDIVPNHMGVSSDNALWYDVLENGRARPTPPSSTSIDLPQTARSRAVRFCSRSWATITAPP